MHTIRLDKTYKDPALEKERQFRLLEIRFDKENPGRLGGGKSPRAFETAIKASRLGLKSWLSHSMSVIDAFRNCNTDEHADALQRLLVAVGRQKTNLLDNYYHVPSYGKNPFNNYLYAIIRMARYHDKWVRQPENWKRKSYNAGRQFMSLARHLFANYDIPDFMHAAWFENQQTLWINGPQPLWYIYVAQGGNIRHCDELPIHMSKKMAHIFLRVPSDLTIDEAIRWAQITHQGGDKAFARGILGTKLNSFYKRQEGFWETVIHWFIRHPMIDPNQIGPVIDYIDNRRFVPQQNIFINGVFHQFVDPPESNFTMKDRDPTTLLRRVEEWHDSLTQINRRTRGVSDVSWDSCGISDFERIEGKTDPTVWRIVELLSAKELFAEGKALKHCVYSYTYGCSRKQSAIFSMTRSTKKGVDNVLTIQVDLINGRIAETRGKHNSMPSQQQKRIVGMWAQKTNLTVGKYLW